MYTIHPTNSGKNFTTMADLKLLMYVLYGYLLTPTTIKAYCQWQEQSPYDMNIMNDEDFLVAEAGRLESAPLWMQQMYRLITKGVGRVPAMFGSPLRNQTTQDRYNTLLMIPGISEAQRVRILLHFDTLYAVQREPLKEVSFNKTCKECGCDYYTPDVHQYFCWTCDQQYMAELEEDSKHIKGYQEPTLLTQPLDDVPF